MPVFVPIVIAGISTGISVAQIVMTVGSALYGRNRAASAKRKAARAAREQAEAARAAMNLKFNATNSVANIPVIYGPTRIGGYFALQEVSPDKKFLHLVVVHAEGVCDKGELYLDDTPWQDAKFTTKSTELVQQGTVREWSVNPNFLDQNDPAIIAKYSVETPKMVQNPLRRSLVHWEFFSGTDDQPACQTLIDALPGKWTTAHKLSGVCYSYVRLEFDPDVWKSIPTITVSTNGKRVIDPRNYQMAPSSNPALALRDYLLSERYGRGLSIAEVNDASFAAAANYCDQAIFMGHPNTVPRYAIGGLIDTAKACTDNVQELLEHMRGELQFSEGVYSLVIDKAEAPVMSFDADNLVGKLGVKKPDRRDRLNQLQARFIDPSRNYEESIVTVKNADWRQEDGGILLESQRDCSLAQDERRARYLLERELRDSRNGMVISFVALPLAARLQPLDVFTLSHPSTGWVNKQFRAITVKQLPNGDVEVTAREYDAGLYVENPLTALPPPPSSSLPDPFAVMPAPSGLSITSDNQTLWSGEILSRFKVTWLPVSGLLSDYRVRWRKQSETTWQELRTRDTLAYLPAIPNGPYFISVAAVSSFGRIGEEITAEGTLLSPSGKLPDVVELMCTFGRGGDFVFSWMREPLAKHYAVEISVSGAVRRTVTVAESNFTYTFEMNKADGLSRSITCKVKAISSAGLASANWATKTETNSPPAALTGLNAWGNALDISFTCAYPSDVDFAGVVCHLGDTANFTPSADTLSYQGPLLSPVVLATRKGVPLEVGKTYYLRVAGFDAFGTDSLNFSPSLAVKSLRLGGEVFAAGSVAADALDPALKAELDKGVAASNTLAASAAPKIVATKPATKVADVVFVTADKTLYRWDGTKYVDSVAAASLTGKVVKSQLETSVISDLDKAAAFESRITAVETGKASASSVTTLEAKVAAQGELNLLDLSGWRLGNFAFPLNGLASENEMVMGVGADGVSTPLWVCKPSGDGGADGGWNTQPFIVDPTKTYKFVVAVRREVVVAGQTYFGPGTGTVCNLNSATVNSNPYFSDVINLPLNKWFLLVGYVFPAGSTGHTHAGSGIFDLETGTLYAGGLNFCWKAGQTWSVHRAYFYYTANTSVRQYFDKPSVSIVSGAVPVVPKLSTLAATKTELNAQITRIDSVVSDVAGKASASSVANLEATINGKLDAKASVTQLNSAIADVEGRASATSQTQVTARFNALRKEIDVWPSSLGNVPTHMSFYPVYIELTGVAAGVLDIVIERDEVHLNALHLGSYTCSIRCRPSVRGHASGVTYSVEQTTGYGTYNWGVGKIEPSLTNQGILVWLRGGMTHIVKVLTPNVSFTVHHAGYSSGASSNNGYTFIASGGVSYGMFQQSDSPLFPYLNKKLLPQGQIEKGSVESLTAIEATATQALSVGNGINGKLTATWQVQLDVAGRVSSLKAFNDGSTSAFKISADKVLISNSANLIPDPFYEDLSWWNCEGIEVETSSTPGSMGSPRRLVLRPGSFNEFFSDYFVMEAGVRYRLSVLVWGDSAAGGLQVALHVPGVIYCSFHNAGSDQWCTTGHNGLQRFTCEYTMSGAVTGGKSNIRIKHALTSGVYVIGAIKVEKMSNAELIVDGEITTNKLAAGSVTAEKVGANRIITNSANIGDAVVDTLQIKGNAVSVSASASGGRIATLFFSMPAGSAGQKVGITCSVVCPDFRITLSGQDPYVNTAFRFTLSRYSAAAGGVVVGSWSESRVTNPPNRFTSTVVFEDTPPADLQHYTLTCESAYDQGAMGSGNAQNSCTGTILATLLRR